jgi:hypothetical protein
LRLHTVLCVAPTGRLTPPGDNRARGALINLGGESPRNDAVKAQLVASASTRRGEDRPEQL